MVLWPICNVCVCVLASAFCFLHDPMMLENAQAERYPA